MATTTATITINSTDLLTDELSLSTTATLTTAGTATGLTSASGLSRTNFTNDPIQSKVIYRSDDATADGANKKHEGSCREIIRTIEKMGWRTNKD